MLGRQSHQKREVFVWLEGRADSVFWGNACESWRWRDHQYWEVKFLTTIRSDESPCHWFLGTFYLSDTKSHRQKYICLFLWLKSLPPFDVEWDQLFTLNRALIFSMLSSLYIRNESTLLFISGTRTGLAGQSMPNCHAPYSPSFICLVSPWPHLMW